MTKQYEIMDTKRAYKFRIYPDSKRQKEIDERLILSQKLYNKILEKAKSSYEKNKKSKVNKSTFNKYMKDAIAENKEFLQLYSQTRQDVFIRVQKSYQNFFRRCKEKAKGKRVKVGFPRFKSRDFYRSITYPQDNGAFAIENKRKGIRMLRVSRIGRMRIEPHRDIAGRIKTVTIKREAGKYYAVFTAATDIEIPKIKDSNPVGIDVGLKTFAMFSDCKFIAKPKFRKNAQKRIAIWQRRVARKVKGSRNRERAKLKLQQKWNTVNNQNNDFIQKETTKLLDSGYTSFAFEDLPITNMMKNHHLADSIQNACWGKFMQILSYKAESAGIGMEYVNPRNTTRMCSRCGAIGEIGLETRTYRCARCGLSMDRDLNASINILKRATVGHTGSNASGDTVPTMQRASQTASMNQEHTLQQSEIYVAGEAHDL